MPSKLVNIFIKKDGYIFYCILNFHSTKSCKILKAEDRFLPKPASKKKRQVPDGPNLFWSCSHARSTLCLTQNKFTTIRCHKNLKGKQDIEYKTLNASHTIVVDISIIFVTYFFFFWWNHFCHI